MSSAPGDHHARGVALMLASTACFTANVLLVRALGTIEAVNIWLVTAVRFVVGLAIVVPLYSERVQVRRVFRNRKLAGRGLIGGLGVFGFYLTVIHLGAGRATFINNTYVIFGALMAVWVLREPFRPALATGSVAALGGLALLTNAFATGSQTQFWDFIAVLTAIGSAYVVVTIRQLHATEHTSTIFAAQCVYGLLICGVPALLQTDSHSILAWTLMIVAAAAATAGQLTMTRAFRELSVAEGSLLQMLVPLGIAGGGVLFFRERFAVHELIGAALIIGGTTFTAVRRA